MDKSDSVPFTSAIDIIHTVAAAAGTAALKRTTGGVRDVVLQGRAAQMFRPLELDEDQVAADSCATLSLLFVKKGRRMAVYKGLRRFDRCRAVRPGAGHAGHQSDMPDSIPLEQRNRPPSHWNAVRHHSGMLSAIIPESCPSWRGTRTRLGDLPPQSRLKASTNRQ